MGPWQWAPLALAPLAPVLGEVRGVAPSDQAKYGSDEFRCFSAEATASALPPDVVNDGFCDCADGSDEPGTDACAGQSSTFFYCANVQSDAALIYASRVNDGVCDCCDGSDEWEAEQRGHRSCRNSCAEEGRALQRQRAQQISELRSGIEQRSALIGKAKAERLASDQELQKLRAKLPDLEAKEQKSREVLAAAEAAVDDERRSASNATAVQDIPPVPAAPSTTSQAALEPAGEEQETAEKPVVSEYSKWMDGAEKVLEEKPVVSEYSKWMDGAEQVLKADAEDAEDADSVAPNPAEWDVEENDDDFEEDGLSGLQRIAAKLREVWTALKGAVFGNKTPAEKALERAKELHNEAKKQLKHDKVRIEELEEKLKSGEEEQELAFSGLTDRCIEKSIGAYKYKICFFKDAKQDHVSIGRWKGWSSSSSPGSLVGMFDGGQFCPGGPERSLAVKFRCGNEELLDVTEPSRCAYEAQLKHPAACTRELLSSLENKGLRKPTDEL